MTRESEAGVAGRDVRWAVRGMSAGDVKTASRSCAERRSKVAEARAADKNSLANGRIVLANFLKMGTIMPKRRFEQLRELRVSRLSEERRWRAAFCVNDRLSHREGALAARYVGLRCLVSVASHLSSFGPSPTIGKEIAHNVS
jgi:hypothetical protein